MGLGRVGERGAGGTDLSRPRHRAPRWAPSSLTAVSGIKAAEE